MTISRTTPGPVHDEYASPAAWDAIAAGYAEFVAPGEQSFAAEALHLVGLTREDTFVDVAAGPGGLALAAARLGADVLATDFGPRACSRSSSRGSVPRDFPRCGGG